MPTWPTYHPRPIASGVNHNLHLNRTILLSINGDLSALSAITRFKIVGFLGSGDLAVPVFLSSISHVHDLLSPWDKSKETALYVPKRR